MAGYDPEDVTALQVAVNGTASTLCLAQSFNDKCGEFVKTKILTSGDQGISPIKHKNDFHKKYF